MVRPIAVGEAGALRELRLRALRDAPEGFASDLAGDSALGFEHWQRLTVGGDKRTTLVAQADDDRLVGMAGGRWFDQERGIAQLWGLWVEPALRGGGVGAELVAQVNAWAAGAGAGFVRLGVLESGGEPVKAFYRRLGFVALDEPAPLPANPSRLATFMVRPV